MGADANTIWRVPAYLPYLQSRLTEAAISAAEKKLGYAIPVEYLNLLRMQNGGYIRYSLSESPHDSIAGIGPRFPSVTVFDWDDMQEYVDFPLTGLVPFDGDGHWHLCLDYRADRVNPSVTYVDVECNRTSNIAASFADYLALLKVEVGDEFVLESVSDIETAIATLSSALSTNFDPPSDWAHGYTVYRASLGSLNNPEWLWISPNTVPRGFVRRDDARYADLKNLMPGHADRYPELPARSYILSATENVRVRVVTACEEAKISLRRLQEYVGGE